MSNDNATKRLRELLDKRGCWHYDHENDEQLRDEPDLATSWHMGGASVCAVPDNKGTFDLWIDHATPEQAVVSTLGRGTCHIVKTWSDSDYDEDWRYRCSECGCFIGVYERDQETGDVISADNYCPNCGREVVE